jgi:hypothetical protein
MKQESDNNSTQRIKEYFTSTPVLTLGPLYIGVLSLFIGSFIGQKIFINGAPQWYVHSVFAFSFAWEIISCLFVVIRREMPRGPFAPRNTSIKGFWAVFWGLLSLIVLSCMEVYFLYLLVVDIT